MSFGFIGRAEKEKTLAGERLIAMNGEEIRHHIHVYSPLFSDYPFSEQFTASVDEIVRTSKCDVIITAFGVPKQKLWYSESKQFLVENRVARVSFFVGTIGMPAGTVKRAPKILTRLSLEGF